MLKAKDIMIQEVITVTKDTPIFHALELLAKHNITDIPVVEDDMRDSQRKRHTKIILCR
ncbi:MAG: CBS domain-containing protein [Planctomycetota bacterium]|jgi:CBS domain-containing protein